MENVTGKFQPEESNDVEQYTKDVFVSAIRFLLKKRHVTQKQIAERLNVTENTVGRWCDLRYPTLPDLAQFVMIARILDTDPEVFINGFPIEGEDREMRSRKTQIYAHYLSSPKFTKLIDFMLEQDDLDELSRHLVGIFKIGRKRIR